VRRIYLFLVICAMQVILFAGVATAQEIGFFDGFDYFDTTRWSKENHNLGRSYLNPNNVSVGNGNLQIKIPAHTLDGGEIRSNDLKSYGTYYTRMNLPNAPSSITGFFLYKSPDYESEIDVELYNDSSRRIVFSTYANGSRTHTKTMLLPFDATAGFHRYRFDYASGSVAFYADGKLMKVFVTNIPQTSMHLLVNTWFPSWLEGRKQNHVAYNLVDYVGYKPR